MRQRKKHKQRKISAVPMWLFTREDRPIKEKSLFGYTIAPGERKMNIPFISFK